MATWVSERLGAQAPFHEAALWSCSSLPASLPSWAPALAPPHWPCPAPWCRSPWSWRVARSGTSPKRRRFRSKRILEDPWIYTHFPSKRGDTELRRASFRLFRGSERASKAETGAERRKGSARCGRRAAGEVGILKSRDLRLLQTLYTLRCTSPLCIRYNHIRYTIYILYKYI